MADTKTPPFSINVLSPEELEGILRRIDENLELRPLLVASDSVDETHGDDPAFVPLPDLGDVPERLHAVRSFNAPYFLIRERGLRGALKRLANLPLRVFGFKQALFNAHTLDVLDRLTLQAQALRQRSEQTAAQAQGFRRWRQAADERLQQLASELDEPISGVAPRPTTVRHLLAEQHAEIQALTARLTALEARAAEAPAPVEAIPQPVQEALNRIEENHNGLHRWIDSVVQTQQTLTEQHHGHSAWIQEVVDGQQVLARELHGHTDWIELVQREVQAVALSSRAGGATTTVRPEPRIQDPAKYAALAESMPDGLLVNLGCGVRPKAGWINVDMRPFPYVDVVADVRTLPFEPGSVAAIEAAHLVEHFRQHEMQETILPYWRSLLKPGGTLRIVCPNAQAIIARSADGRLTLEEARALIFGGQEYEGNDHFAMYWPEALQALVMAAGFSRAETLATERENGICPEVEVLAHL